MRACVHVFTHACSRSQRSATKKAKYVEEQYDWEKDGYGQDEEGGDSPDKNDAACNICKL